MTTRLVSLLLLCIAMAAAAADADELLPVDQAFALRASAPARDHVRLDWAIADGYYLYRSRIKTKTTAPGLVLAPPQLPDGEKKQDEFLGEQEVYHHALTAIQPLGEVSGDTVELIVTVQGCHEREPKICYPPHPATLTVTLPPAATTMGGEANPLKHALGQLGGAASVPVTTESGTDALPLPPEQAFRFEAIAASPTELLARWTMPKGYYLYRDKTVLTSGDAGVRIGAPRWPAGVPHKDEHFGDVTVYFDQVELPVPIARADGAAGTLALIAEFQGCEDGGVCYPVMTRMVSLDLPIASADQLAAARSSADAAPAPTSADPSDEQRLAATLSNNRWLALLSFFGFGLLLAFTPCVFPMIPILSGIIAGAGDTVSTRRAFVLSLVYVLASCLVFTFAGVLAGLAGANLQAAFQKPWILWSFAALFVLLSLSMFGFYELQLPGRWQSKIVDVSNRQQGGSLAGVAVMGVLSALIVGPCVAPPLAAAVLYIGQTRDPLFGGLALFVLSLGMGAPLVAAGTAAGQLLPRAGAWMDAVKAVFGVTFLGLAIWMLSRILDPVWIMLMIGALAVGSGVYLGALERLPEGASGWKTLWKAFGVLLLLLGAAQLIGAAAGSRDLLQPLKGIAGGGAAVETHLPFRTIKTVTDLERERGAGRRVMLDFYADWCVSCKEMEKFTFSNSQVQQSLAGIVLLKADVTANDEADQALLRHFGLFGPPATIFFGADGQERRGARLIGFEDADKFIARVGRAAQ